MAAGSGGVSLGKSTDASNPGAIILQEVIGLTGVNIQITEVILPERIVVYRTTQGKVFYQITLVANLVPVVVAQTIVPVAPFSVLFKACSWSILLQCCCCHFCGRI